MDLVHNNNTKKLIREQHNRLGIWSITRLFSGKVQKRIRDRSFFTREGGLVGFGGGHVKKNGFRGGAIPKKLGKNGGAT